MKIVDTITDEIVTDAKMTTSYSESVTVILMCSPDQWLGGTGLYQY